MCFAGGLHERESTQDDGDLRQEWPRSADQGTPMFSTESV